MKAFYGEICSKKAAVHNKYHAETSLPKHFSVDLQKKDSEVIEKSLDILENRLVEQELYNYRSLINTINTETEKKKLKELYFTSNIPHLTKESSLDKIKRAVHIKKEHLTYNSTLDKKGKVDFIKKGVHSIKNKARFDVIMTRFLDFPLWIQILLCTSYIVGIYVIFGLVYFILNLICSDSVEDSCIVSANPKSYTDHFLFSLESSTTIGYGGRQPTPWGRRCWPIFFTAILHGGSFY